MDEAMKKIRDEFARQYWNEFVSSSNRAHAEILFKDGFDAAMERTKILEEALGCLIKICEPICELRDDVNDAKKALAKFRGEK